MGSTTNSSTLKRLNNDIRELDSMLKQMEVEEQLQQQQKMLKKQQTTTVVTKQIVKGSSELESSSQTGGECPIHLTMGDVPPPIPPLPAEMVNSEPPAVPPSPTTTPSFPVKEDEVVIPAGTVKSVVEKIESTNVSQSEDGTF